MCHVDNITSLRSLYNVSHSRFAKPTSKRHVVPSGASVQSPQTRPTVATSAFGGPDVTPTTRGRPVTRHATAPTVASTDF